MTVLTRLLAPTSCTASCRYHPKPRNLPRQANGREPLTGAAPASLRALGPEAVGAEKDPDSVGTDAAGAFTLMRVLALVLLHCILHRVFIRTSLIAPLRVCLGSCRSGLSAPRANVPVLSAPSADGTTAMNLCCYILLSDAVLLPYTDR